MKNRALASIILRGQILQRSKAMITVSSVYKYFKEVRAVQDVSLEVREGEYVALLGPNGAGKTTLVEMIEGLRKPDSGRIKIAGMEWRHHQTKLRRLMGISLQENKFIDKLTAREIMSLFSSFYGGSEADIPGILELVGLTEKSGSYSMNLSHGQRQKLALGIAIINHPKILILDEPTTGLDPNARRDIWRILKDLKAEGTSLILTTHYMEEAEYLCDRIIIMNRGKILAEGTLTELLDMHDAREIISFTIGGENASSGLPDSVKELEGVLGLSKDKDPRSGRLYVDEIVRTLPTFLAMTEREGITLERLECRKMNLDDLFVSLTGRRLDD